MRWHSRSQAAGSMQYLDTGLEKRFHPGWGHSSGITPPFGQEGFRAGDILGGKTGFLHGHVMTIAGCGGAFW